MRCGFALLMALCFAPWTQAAIVDGGRYGPVQLLLPTGATRGYVVLFSDTDGWKRADDLALQALARAGAIAVGVDTPRYLRNIATTSAACDQLVGDAEGLSRSLQREYGHEAYWFPILAGVGDGATLARVTLSQAPLNTFTGAAEVDPTGFVPGARPLCAIASAALRAGNGFRYGAVSTPPGFLSAGLTPAASTRSRTQTLLLLQQGTPMQIRAVSGELSGAVLTLLEPHLSGAVSQGVASLPLIELPVSAASPIMAVVLSGDGGWRDLDKTIAEDLQSDGVPVVGWDSVRYFWRKKSPDQTAQDLSRALQWYLLRWRAQRVVLIGYSFGADVLPFVYNRLAPEIRAHVVLVSLLSLSHAADWEIKVSGLFGASASADATATGPALAQMPAAVIDCFYGIDDHDSACPSLEQSGTTVVRTTGGHHFDHDYRAIERRILSDARTRLASLPTALAIPR